MHERITQLLVSLYGDSDGLRTAERVLSAVEEARTSIARNPASQASAGTRRHGAFPLSEADTVLISYGDSLVGTAQNPLSNLDRFLSEQLAGVIRGVHVLPFSPYTSDDGFSVSDYHAVNPELGSWSDIEQLASGYTLMADLVLNHCSASHPWFQGFLRQEPPFDDFFVTVDPDTDTSMVVRPRARPLLTKFETSAGPRWVWTTFSEDQVDLNYRNPDVLYAMLEVLILYLIKGVRILRLDAVAYLWKEPGTSCIHLPQTHAVVQLMREVMQAIVPDALLITETNVPHEENISYFGTGSNEAHMVYNFSLPPLTLDAFVHKDARILSSWAAGLALPAPGAAFFNFLSSHDGIGVQPAVGILPQQRFTRMLEAVEERGGRISYKATASGDVPYELNITYFSAIVGPDAPLETRIQAFLCAHAIMCALSGVPAIYIHSLLGSSNWSEGMAESGHNRTINRERLDYPALVRDLANPESVRSRVCRAMLHLISTRSTNESFSPDAGHDILESPPELLVIGRAQSVLCIHNVSDLPVAFEIPDYVDSAGSLSDLLSASTRQVKPGTTFEVPPYGVHWFS